jgi:hypothetical protein
MMVEVYIMILWADILYTGESYPYFGGTFHFPYAG